MMRQTAGIDDKERADNMAEHDQHAPNEIR